MNKMLCIWLTDFFIDLWKKKEPQFTNRLLAVYNDKGIIVAAEKKLLEKGIAPGIPVKTAVNLLSSLILLPEPEEGEEELIKIAHKMFSFTPKIAVRFPDVIFLYISSTAHLFGGSKALAIKVYNQINSIGFSVRISLASSPFPALLLAKYATKTDKKFLHKISHYPICILLKEKENEFIHSLPVEAFYLLTEPNFTIHNMMKTFYLLGLKTIGEVAKFPSTSWTVRFGKGGKLIHDYLSKRMDLKNLIFLKPEQERKVTLNFSWPTTHTNMILKIIEATLPTLIKYLEKQGEMICSLTIILYLENGEEKKLSLIPASPTRNIQLFLSLLSIRLQTFSIDSPIIGGEIIASQVCKEEARNKTFMFLPPNEGIELNSLLSRLEAVLGQKGVKKYYLKDAFFVEKVAVQVEPIGCNPRLFQNSNIPFPINSIYELPSFIFTNPIVLDTNSALFHHLSRSPPVFQFDLFDARTGDIAHTLYYRVLYSGVRQWLIRVDDKKGSSSKSAWITGMFD